jgi:CspA family cold shock protein
MQTGSIARVTDNGYGFIKPDQEGGRDLFFHATSLVDVEFNSLREGDKVQFETEEGPKGPNAVKVSRV